MTLPAVQVGLRQRTEIKLASGDFDGDGFLDVAVLSSFKVIYLRGTRDGLVLGEEIFENLSHFTLTTADFNGDGFLDVASAINIQNRAGAVGYLRGSSRGLKMARRFEYGGNRAIAITSGDFNGDGFPDVAVVDFDSGTVEYLRQRFLQPHVNHFFDPEDPAAFPVDALVEPRNPPNYSLALPQEPFSEGTQVCLVPGLVFDLPHGEAFQRGKYLTNVSASVTLLRETTEIEGTAQLTLRLRDHDAELLEEVLAAPERLRVFRRNLETAVGEVEETSTAGLELVDFFGAPAVVFPIRRFGTYVVALERDR